MSRFSSSFVACFLAFFFSIGVSGPALAGSIASGPTFLAGYSGDEDAADDAGDLGLVLGGWRWRFDGADWLDEFLARGRIDFSWAVEPLVGMVAGHRSAFETSVVPYFRLAPAGMERVTPYFEGGIGVAYTTLSDYGLGAHFHFSDNAGIGVTFGGERRWSVGYRYRHLSHAGLLDDRNDGLNAHFLTIGVE